ncbi:MAG TPA: DNA adenine methylase, partial [Bacillota bacterium]|nr:DNA adenine methylase [Bacillota bacterium]
GFGREDQLRLKEVCVWLDQRGVKFVLSNSNTVFIRSLYAFYEIRYVRAGRAINCDPRKRGKVVELLIKNY